MYVIKWLILYVVWCVRVATFELRCDHPLCTSVNKNSILSKREEFTVEGRPISTLFSDWEYKINLLSINCHGWAALDSDAMPKFTTEYVANLVELTSCPPPTRPLSAALEALNVTIPQDNTGSISLYKLAPEPALTKQHYEGFEHLRWITITYLKPTTNHVIDILSVFRNLRGLRLGNVPFPVSTYRRFQSTLGMLILEDTVVPPLTIILNELSYLQNLTLFFNIEIDHTMNTNKTKSKTEPSRLENLQLTRWKERQISPIEHCENLISLVLSNPKVDELPNCYIAACPRLEKLVVRKARNLATLPSRLLEGATALKYFNMTTGVLEALPSGLFKGAPNLRVINLSNNRIRTIAIDVTLGPRLRYLSLAFNRLTSEALNALASSTSLTELNLSDNPILTDLCDQYGYSHLQNLTQLRRLSLEGTRVTRICIDWRQNLTLEQIDLTRTGVNTITVLEFSEHVRDLTLNNATVLVYPASLLQTYKYNLRKKQQNKQTTTNKLGH